MTTLQASLKDLQLRDLAAINVIMPSHIQFSYTDQDVLMVQFGTPVNRKTARDKVALALRNRGDEFRLTEPRPVKPDVIKKTIETRNKKFKAALITFVDGCKAAHIDAEEHLTQESNKYIPIPPNRLCELPIDGAQEATARPLAETLNGLRQQPFYHNQLETHKTTFPAKQAAYGELSQPLHTDIQNALEQKGIDRLYMHQTEAIDGLRNGQHVIVATSTASGKSLIYQIPVLEKLLEDQSSRAMYIFPTKALAQDQLRAFREIMASIPSLCNVMVATFDGDTPSDKRALIRSKANIIFTNPDMLHHAILPFANAWKGFLVDLKYVVVDELHVYNGLFGTNVALVMRRLQRMCDHFGNDAIQFVSCSATIGNPDEHMKLVFGINNVKLVDEDGAPCGKKEFVVWSPPLLHESDPLAGRKSAISEGADLFEYLVVNNVRTIVFCKIRKTCELLMKQMRENLQNHERNDLLGKIMSYRGGYTPQDRRQIEKRMFNGEMLGVIATNALELGVDIGSLDAVIMIGVPVSISSLWQQSGRAGRRNTDSLSVVIMDDSPMDRHYVTHPSLLLEKKADDIQFEVEDSLALEGHIQCAAEELPLNIQTDQRFFGNRIKEICEQRMVPIQAGLFRPLPEYRPYPSKFVNIRNIIEESFCVVDVTDGRNVVLEDIDASRAPYEIYEGAIFIHKGITYLVDECNDTKKYAKVHLVRVDWTTQQRDYTNVDVIQVTTRRKIRETDHFVHYGDVQVENVVFGYYKVDKTKRIIDAVDLHMDPIKWTTTGLWVDVPATAVRKIEQLEVDLMACIHSVAHCLISLLPRFASLSSNDIKTECKNPHAKRWRPPRITLYETMSSGIAKLSFQSFGDLVEMSIARINECPCDSGCPSCVHLVNCSEYNMMTCKTGALVILQALLAMDVSAIEISDTERVAYQAAIAST